MAMAISARRKTDIGKLAADETLNKVVDAIKNSETVQAQKEEIQTGGRVLATIPQDYKKTVEEVSSLKEDLSNKISKFYASNKMS